MHVYSQEKSKEKQDTITRYFSSIWVKMSLSKLLKFILAENIIIILNIKNYIQNYL